MKWNWKTLPLDMSLHLVWDGCACIDEDCDDCCCFKWYSKTEVYGITPIRVVVCLSGRCPASVDDHRQKMFTIQRLLVWTSVSTGIRLPCNFWMADSTNWTLSGVTLSFKRDISRTFIACEQRFMQFSDEKYQKELYMLNFTETKW